MSVCWEVQGVYGTMLYMVVVFLASIFTVKVCIYRRSYTSLASQRVFELRV